MDPANIATDTVNLHVYMTLHGFSFDTLEYPRISLKICQRARPHVDGAVQTRVADAEVVKGSSDVRQKRIPLAKDDTFGLANDQ